jgi:hypothetical protein
VGVVVVVMVVVVVVVVKSAGRQCWRGICTLN